MCSEAHTISRHSFVSVCFSHKYVDFCHPFVFQNLRHFMFLHIHLLNFLNIPKKKNACVFFREHSSHYFLHFIEFLMHTFMFSASALYTFNSSIRYRIIASIFWKDFFCFSQRICTNFVRFRVFEDSSIILPLRCRSPYLRKRSIRTRIGFLSLVNVVSLLIFDVVYIEFDLCLAFSFFSPLEKVTFVHVDIQTPHMILALVLLSDPLVWVVVPSIPQTPTSLFCLCSFNFRRISPFPKRCLLQQGSCVPFWWVYVRCHDFHILFRLLRYFFLVAFTSSKLHTFVFLVFIAISSCAFVTIQAHVPYFVFMCVYLRPSALYFITLPCFFERRCSYWCTRVLLFVRYRHHTCFFCFLDDAWVCKSALAPFHCNVSIWQKHEYVPKK